MIVRPIYESQSVDDEIIKITKEVSEAITRKLAKYRGVRGLFRLDPRLDYRLYYKVMLNTDVNMDGGRAVVKYAVMVNVMFDSEMKNDDVNGSCNRFPDVIKSTLRDELVQKGPGLYELPDDIPVFDVRIDLYHCVVKPESRFAMEVSLPELEETLSHELMHVKSCFRELMEGRARGTDDLSSSLKSDEVENRFDFIKYFLSPNEMKSYITGIYSEIKKRTELAKKSSPDQNELKAMIKNAGTWKQFEKVRGYMNEYGAEKKDEWNTLASKFLEDADKAQLKKVTGVSTPDDLMKYLQKMSKSMERKLVKAAYKGYCDGMGNSDNTYNK